MSEVSMQKPSDQTMRNTGERLLPEVRNRHTIEHLHRYALATILARDKDVLDIASGEGYGSFLLCEAANKVIGVDIVEEAVLHAQQRYQRPNLEFRLGSATAIPVDDASLDLVVSFETLEHVEDHETMMREAKRVLRPNGILFISTPDTAMFSGLLGNQNHFHIKELTTEEFDVLLAKHFKNVSLIHQKLTFGSLIKTRNATKNERENKREKSFALFKGMSHHIEEVVEIEQALYNLALATEADLPEFGASFFHGDDVIEGELEAIRRSRSYRIGQRVIGVLKPALRFRTAMARRIQSAKNQNLNGN